MPKKTAAKLVSTGITLLIALVLMAGTTFAWYTLSANPEISGIKLSISANKRLLVALNDPDVDDPNDLNFEEAIDISELLSYYYDLTPVSTADGLNWFVPQYDSKTGELLEPSEFILDTSLYYANSFIVQTENGKVVYNVITNGGVTTSSAISLSGIDLLNAQRKGYYIYVDVWLKTENENGADVRLSYPNYSTDKIRKSKDLGGQFGTYILPLYEMEQTVGDGWVLEKISKNAETSMRIGFQIFGTDSSSIIGSSGTPWFIYEPNADLRSESVSKPYEYNSYVHGYGMGSSAYDNGVYLETRPIGFSSGIMHQVTDVDGNPVYDYTAISDSSVLYENDGNNTFYLKDGSDYTETTGSQAIAENITTSNIFTRAIKEKLLAMPVSLDPDNLIIQMTGEWDITNGETQQKLMNGFPLNSNDIKTFGKFVSATGIYNKITNLRNTIDPGTGSLNTVNGCVIPSSASIYDYDGTDLRPEDTLLTSNYSNQVLLTLKQDEPQRVRLFIWIEGQDPDCWNDIAAGGFRLNLEFAADFKDDPE